MIEKSRLEQAAELSIIQQEQVEPLFQFLQEQPVNSEDTYDGEPLRFTRSVGDIFLTMGIVFLMIAVSISGISGIYYLVPAALFVLLAEWLVRKRNLVLPGMAILLSLLILVFKAVTHGIETTALFGFGVVAVTSFLFYIRYKMPFSHLPLAASLIVMFFLWLEVNVFKNPILFFASGILVFCVAMWFDSRDTKRVSHMSDSAFWLHLLAAPLLVHGLMVAMLNSDQSWVNMFSKEILILCFFAVFFLTALLIDRRAMLIATQLYMVIAIVKILKDNSANAGDITLFIFIAFAMFVIYFGAYWYKSRQFIYGFLSGKAITRYIPDLNLTDSKAKT